MNRKTLQKIIDAIQSDKKEYAMGMLDMLMESLPMDSVSLPSSPRIEHPVHISRVEPDTVTTEGRELDTVAANRLAEIKRMAGDVS